MLISWSYGCIGFFIKWFWDYHRLPIAGAHVKLFFPVVPESWKLVTIWIRVFLHFSGHIAGFPLETNRIIEICILNKVFSRLITRSSCLVCINFMEILKPLGGIFTCCSFSRVCVIFIYFNKIQDRFLHLIKLWNASRSHHFWDFVVFGWNYAHKG